MNCLARAVLGIALAGTLVWHAPAMGQPAPYPSTFAIRDIEANGTTLHVRVGGKGSAVVLIHGFADTGDVWQPLAVALAKNHRVVVPDLRGMGLSAKPDSGYEKSNEAADIRAVLDALGIDHAVVVGHDVGTMVAYAYAKRYPDKTTRLVLLDAPIPGVPPWEELEHLPNQWHHNFTGPEALLLVAGRERIYLDRFWNEFSADPAAIDEGTRAHYAALYAQPGAMKAAFAQFKALPQDAQTNAEFLKTKLTMPVLAVGGEKSFGSGMADEIRNAATDVTAAVISGSGHWLMEEAPEATTRAIVAFIDSKAR